MTAAARKALELIRGYALAGRYLISDHAKGRMRERNVLPQDLDSALRNANSCRVADGDRWRVCGPDVDGDELTVVVAIEDGLIVVTVF